MALMKTFHIYEPEKNYKKIIFIIEIAHKIVPPAFHLFEKKSIAFYTME